MANHQPHRGKNIERLRELRRMKQEGLASLLGITQQAVSKIEQSESVEEEKLEKIAKALGVSVEAIKLFNEAAVFNNIQTNSETSTHNSIVNYQFNPIEKIVELYERLLKSEKEKIELLESLSNKKPN